MMFLFDISLTIVTTGMYGIQDSGLITILDYTVLYNFDNRYASGDYVQGRFYTSVNGDAYFWCESEFIGDYRETDIRFNSQFYP